MPSLIIGLLRWKTTSTKKILFRKLGSEFHLKFFAMRIYSTQLCLLLEDLLILQLKILNWFYVTAKKSLIVYSLSFLSTLVLWLPMYSIQELFSKIKITRKFLERWICDVYFWLQNLFRSSYLLFCLLLYISDGTFAELQLYFSCLCAPGILWRSKAICR